MELHRNELRNQNSKLMQDQLKGFDGPLAQKAARPAGCLRSRRLGGTQPCFLAGICSVLPGAARAATGRIGTALVGGGSCRGLSRSGRTDLCGQETMQKHTGLLRSEAAFGEDDARALQVVRSRRGAGGS